MAALLVCFSISAGALSRLTGWLRMCGNVQLGSVFMFLFMFCTNHRLLEDFGLKHRMCRCFSCSPRLEEVINGDIQITGQLKSFLLMCLPGARTLGFQMWMCFLKKVVSCCLRGRGSVLCHLSEWLPILLCLCVLRLFVFALWIFGKNHLHIFCPLVHNTSHNDPGWWNTDHKVCIVVVLSTNVHTRAYMPTWIHTHCRHTSTQNHMHVDTP